MLDCLLVVLNVHVPSKVFTKILSLSMHKVWQTYRMGDACSIQRRIDWSNEYAMSKTTHKDYKYLEASA